MRVFSSLGRHLADDFLVVTAKDLPVVSADQTKLHQHKGFVRLIIDSPTSPKLRFTFPREPLVLPDGYTFLFDPSAPNKLLTPVSYSTLKAYTELYATCHYYNTHPDELAEDLIELEDFEDLEDLEDELEDSNGEAETDDEGDDI